VPSSASMRAFPKIVLALVGLAGMLGVVALAPLVLQMMPALIMYWRSLAFFWCGGTYAEAKKSLHLSAFGRAHLYSLASVPWLMRQPHYRTGTFQQDMQTNLRNVVLPTGVYGMPLSMWASSRMAAYFAISLVIPLVAFWGSIWRRVRGIDPSAVECFRRSLLTPTDWFQLWRLNCRLASMTALATQSKDFDLEDKWLFIQACQKHKIPVTPVMNDPVTLVAKDVLEEGGMGIHVLRNVVHGGRWILQAKLDNCEAVNKLLPANAPLSTVRVITASRGGLKDLGDTGAAVPCAKALCTVWRAGRQGAATDHSSVMVDVPQFRQSNELGTGSSSAHWYARGFKSWGMPLSSKDGAIVDHPDTGKTLQGEELPSASAAASLCEQAHNTLMPGVPLAGWDVAFCPPKGRPDGDPELILLEANLSCNFFRGSIDWNEYSALLDDYFAAIDAWRRSTN